MGWDIKVPETSCPYYLSRFIHYSCSNWINKTGNCNEEKCPVKINEVTDLSYESFKKEALQDPETKEEYLRLKETEC